MAFQAFVADYSCGAASDFHRTSLPDSAIGKLPVSAIQFKLNIGGAAEIVKKNLNFAIQVNENTVDFVIAIVIIYT